MTFTVLWSPEAEAELMALVGEAADPDAIVRPASVIDGRLCDDPNQIGESRGRASHHN